MDTAYAILVHLVGEDMARAIRGIIKFTPKSEDDGLVMVYDLALDA